MNLRGVEVTGRAGEREFVRRGGKDGVVVELPGYGEASGTVCGDETVDFGGGAAGHEGVAAGEACDGGWERGDGGGFEGEGHFGGVCGGESEWDFLESIRRISASLVERGGWNRELN